tara:strand:+ start:220 stop:327 length:108 start_codon:yes stop_codon:yes gene_type:complete
MDFMKGTREWLNGVVDGNWDGVRDLKRERGVREAG